TGSFTAATVDPSAIPQETALTGYDAQVVDYGQPGYPANIRDAATHQRSVIVWTVGADIPPSSREVKAADGTVTTPAVMRGLTLGYTVIVPAGVTGGGTAALVGQDYRNDASVVRYDTKGNGTTDSTVLVSGTDSVATPPTGTPPAGQFVLDDAANDLSDPSNVYVKDLSVAKRLISTEIGPNNAPNPPGGENNLDANNGDGQIVQGELATFELEVTVPGNSSVRDGVLKDDGKLRWTGNPNVNGRELNYHLSNARVWNAPGVTDGTGDLADGWTFDAATGELRFPEYYQNTSAEDVKIQVRLTAWIDARDASHPNSPAFPNFDHNKTLTNTARFNSKNVAGGNNPEKASTANVTYIRPELAISKTASPATNIKIGDPVTYTLTVSNTSGRPKTYDNVVVDTVPAGLLVQAGSFGVGGVPIADSALTFTGDVFGGAGGTITWSHANVDALREIPATAVLTYKAQIDPTAGAGRSYTNIANVQGYTLPGTLPEAGTRRGDRTATANATVTAIRAAIAKDARLAGTTGSFGNSVSAPIGDTVEYQIDITLQANVNYYDPRIVDDLPAGVALVDSSIAGPVVTSGTPALTGTWTRAYNATTNAHSWSYDGDIAAAPEVRTLRLTYRVDLTNSVAATVNALPNTAYFTWGPTDNAAEGNRQSIEDPANVTVLNPVLSLVKKVDGVDAKSFNPDGTFTYTVTVTNNGNTPAHNVDIEDVVPANVIVTGTHGGTLSGNDPSTGGGTITWSDLGPISDIPGSNTLTLTYTARFADSGHLDTTARRNVAKVTRYESFGTGGRVYVPGENNVPPAQDDARVTPLFPHVVPTKTVTGPVVGKDYGIALVGEAFNWTLTITNAGTGIARDVSVTDTLPANWEYVAGSARIAGLPLTDPIPGGTARTLVWTAPQLEEAGATPLAASAGFAITFDARPLAAARTTPGTGIEVNPHTNTVGVTATDTQGKDRNQAGDYTGDDDTARAYIAEADLKLVKDGIGGVAAGATHPRLHGLAAGTWVPGQGVVAGQYAQPQWRITVTNHGPDASEGPFTFTDAMTLPADVTTGVWSARYYSSPSDTTGTGLGTHAGASFTVGDNTTRLKADGSDRIVLTANVTIGAAATATADQLRNVATAEGQTYERPDHKVPPHLNPNGDDASKPLIPVADLAIDKVVNTTDPAVGGPITWGVTVTNLGPSVSVSSPSAPITITDTVPAHLTGVTATGNTDWDVSASDGFPAKPGDVITWTYRGSSMPVGATAQVTLSGVIVSSHTGQLVNRAQVEPGETPDPVDPNNEAEISVPTNDDTSLVIAKTRVIKAGDEWVVAVDQDPIPPLIAGDPVGYRIDVRNTGTADARELTVVDESPDGLDYASHLGLGGTTWARAAGGTNEAGTTNPGWDTFSLTTPATLPAGETRSFVVTYTTAPTVVGDVENWAEASAENSTNSPRDPDDSGSTRHADLSIVKTHTSPTDGEAAVAGGSVDYRLVVTNHGQSVASAEVSVTDRLPADFSYRTGTARVSVDGATPTPAGPTIDGRDLTWQDLTSGADLPRGATIVITFTADIAPSARPQTGLRNLADVSGPEDTNPDNNHDHDPVDVRTETAMRITKAVEAGPWVAGTEVEYTLTIRNDGRSEAPASVTDTLPTGLTMVSMRGTGWDCSAVVEGAQEGTCAFTGNSGLHPAGAGNATTITVTAHITSSATELPQPLENVAVLTWSDSAGSHTDDDEADITVTRVADLGIEKTALDVAGDETTTVVAGSPSWYRLVVTNHGDSDAIAPIGVTDTLPDGISFVALTGASAVNWTAAVDPANPREVSFTRKPTAGILTGQSAPAIVFEVLVDAAVADEEDLVNHAEIDSDTLDANGDDNPDNDSDDATVTVQRQVDVSIAKSHIASTPDEFPVGAEVRFTLEVTNAGPSAASGIQVTDTLPKGLSYVGLSGTGWSLVGAPIIGPEGATAVTAGYAGSLSGSGEGAVAPTLTVTTRVTAEIGDGSTATNGACVAPAEQNANTDPCDTDEIATVPLADLAIEKSASTPTDEIGAGRQLTWQLDVRNLGPSDSVSSAANRITITDEIPDGMTGVADPSTAQWLATVSRNGEPSNFPARAGDLVTWTFQGERIVADPDPEEAPAHTLVLTGTIEASWIDGEILNLAVITPGETRDPEEPNNTDQERVTPGDSTSLRIAKTRVVLVDGEWVVAAEQDPVPPFRPGTNLSYRITVVNDGPADARHVTVVDESPDGLTYRAHESVSGAWQHAPGGSSSAGDRAGWDTFTLAGTQPVGPEGARSFVVTYTTDPALAKDAAVVNWAEVTAENWPGGYDRDDDDVTSTRSADLSLQKTHTAPAEGTAVLAGETVDYRLVVTNHGPSISDAPILVTDTLPADFSYVAGTALVRIDGGEPVGTEPETAEGRLSWTDVTTGDTLAVGSTVVVTFTAQVAEGHHPATGVLNAAVVDGPNDNNPLNDRDDDPIDVLPLVTLVVEKTAIGDFQV
ncbi:MAG: DUF11 domain-containing protein, partial [Propionibacteriaceae bacterium]|nr:DUF11 domain-containing protein [Propionibacteriaceae bacterium]